MPRATRSAKKTPVIDVSDVEDVAEEPVAKTKPAASKRKSKPVKKPANKPAAASSEVEEAPKTSKRKQTVQNVDSDSDNADFEAPSKKSKRNVKPAENESDDEVESSDKPKKKVQKKSDVPKKVVANKTTTAYKDLDFSCTTKNENGKEWNFKISSWNVDGIRAWIKKGCLDFFEFEKPDIFCLQETKCALEKLPTEATDVDGYKVYWHLSQKDGYAGVGLYSKTEPLSLKYGLDLEEFDDEGRIITAEYEKFYCICVYVPNSGRGLVNLPKRLKWNLAFRKHITALNDTKPVIICGDMNVSHLEIDLANPKTNRKNAGFTQEERDGMTDLLSDGYIDTYRELYPDKTGVYTYWTFMANCRAKNVGWRLDYFIVSKLLEKNICDNIVRSEVFGSDHCPITLFLNL